MINTPTKDFVIQELDRIGCFEIREEPITLKSGKQSNFYADLRKTFGHPYVLKNIAQLIANEIYLRYSDKIDSLPFQRETCVCGMQYAAGPLSTLVSQLTGLGQIVLRKEAKKHGTKKLIEGLKDEYNRVIIIDDVMTSGISILEGISALKPHLSKLDVFVVLNRGEDLNEDFKSSLEGIGGELKCVFDVNDLPLKYRLAINPKSMYETLNECIKRYDDSHPCIQKLFKIAKEKQSNLIVSIDDPDPLKVLDIINKVGQQVVCVKLHYDILQFDVRNLESCRKNWDSFLNELLYLKKKFNFLVFEDRKFMDIGNTVYLQYSRVQEMYMGSIDFTNACMTSGPDIVSSMRTYHTSKNEVTPGTCLLLLAQMSSRGSTFAAENIQMCKNAANSTNGKDFVGGYICQSKHQIEEVYASLDSRQDLVYFTPGVHLEVSKDIKGQCYRTVSEAIEKDGCDFIIVGRGIINASDVSETAKLYRKEGWNSFLNKISK